MLLVALQRHSDIPGYSRLQMPMWQSRYLRAHLPSDTVEVHASLLLSEGVVPGPSIRLPGTGLCRPIKSS